MKTLVGLLLVTGAVTLFVGMAAVQAQADITPTAMPVFNSPTSSDIFTLEPPTATITSSPTDLPTLTLAPTDNPPPVTPTLEDAASPPEVTDEATATAISDAELTPTDTPTDDGLSLTPTVLATSSPTLTIPPEVTETETPTVTASFTASPTVVSDYHLMPTATLDIPMAFVSARAVYQNRLPDNSGIRVYVLNAEEVVLSVTATDTKGYYSVAVPTEAAFWLIIEAPLHRRIKVAMQPSTALLDVVLAGGDIDGDGCIGAADLGLLTASFDVPGSTATDITGDGVTNVADLAIASANFEPDCGVTAAASVDSMPTPTSPAAESETAPVTDVWTLTPPAETADPTRILVPTATVIVEPTTAPTPSPDSELTEAVTFVPEATPAG